MQVLRDAGTLGGGISLVPCPFLLTFPITSQGDAQPSTGHLGGWERALELRWLSLPLGGHLLCSSSQMSLSHAVPTPSPRDCA